ncbi:MAG: ABC transporter permease [Oscillospiraceae bacterium]|nr:ABC transporter permease [Oscillospiraceae bacterium]
MKLNDKKPFKLQQNIIMLFATVVLLGLFSLVNPNLIRDKYMILSMVQQFAPYAVMGLGVTFVIATGGIDLSLGTVCIASAVLAGKLYTMGIIPLWATIPVMMIIGTLCGLLNGLMVAKLKIPAFIATLGTMMVSRGLSALLAEVPNIFFPTGTWYNKIFSSLTIGDVSAIPMGLFWVIGLMLICMYLMYKNKIGRYILAIGSNEEATRLSGINTDNYKIFAYTFAGLFCGIAAIFYSAAFPTIACATGNGMELDAIAGVYIGGTSSAGGVASVSGSVIGAILLVVIRSGLNMVLAKLGISLNSTYVTYVLTGIIVVVAILMDIIKTNNQNKVKIEKVEETKKEAPKA